MRTIMSIMVLLIGLANAEANLVVNGDFESGNTGFISSYNYIPHANQVIFRNRCSTIPVVPDSCCLAMQATTVQ